MNILILFYFASLLTIIFNFIIINYNFNAVKLTLPSTQNKNF